MDKVENIIWKLSLLPGFESGEGVSENIISEAEKKLGIIFSSQYRYFLKKYSWIEGEGYEIMGIFDEDFSGSDVVGYNLDNIFDEGYNGKWISFHDLAGETVSFDYNRINDEGEPKVFYNLFTYQRKDAAEDFVSYLEKLYEEIKD